MRLRLIPVLSVALALAGSGAPAQAQNCEAPPGSAAVDQYCEAIPEGGGSQSGNDFQRERATSGAAATPSGDSPGLPAGTATALESAGQDGEAVAKLAAGGAGRTTASEDAAEPAGEVAGATASSDDVSSSPLKAVSASVQNGPVAGSLLIWALLGSTIAVLALGWIRYRRSGTDTPE